MRIRPACFVFGVLLLVPPLAYADSHNADYYGGGSGGGGGSTLKGFIVAFGKDLPKQPLAKHGIFWGVVGGASVQFGGHAGRDVTQVVLGVGPRVTFSKSDWQIHGHAQFGDVYTNDGLLINTKGEPEPNDFDVAAGAAIDYLFPHGSFPGTNTHLPGLGFRLIEVDRVFNHGDRSSVWRFSAGLVYRVPKL
jgi:hypothetical protein